MSLTFKARVIIKMVAAGLIEGNTVTIKSGFFTYILPKWVHYCHLIILFNTSMRWQETYIEIVQEMFDVEI